MNLRNGKITGTIINKSGEKKQQVKVSCKCDRCTETEYYRKRMVTHVDEIQRIIDECNDERYNFLTKLDKVEDLAYYLLKHATCFTQAAKYIPAWDRVRLAVVVKTDDLIIDLNNYVEKQSTSRWINPFAFIDLKNKLKRVNTLYK